MELSRLIYATMISAMLASPVICSRGCDNNSNLPSQTVTSSKIFQDKVLSPKVMEDPLEDLYNKIYNSHKEKGENETLSHFFAIVGTDKSIEDKDKYIELFKGKYKEGSSLFEPYAYVIAKMIGKLNEETPRLIEKFDNIYRIKRAESHENEKNAFNYVIYLFYKELNKEDSRNYLVNAEKFASILDKNEPYRNVRMNYLYALYLTDICENPDLANKFTRILEKDIQASAFNIDLRLYYKIITIAQDEKSFNRLLRLFNDKMEEGYGEEKALKFIEIFKESKGMEEAKQRNFADEISRNKYQDEELSRVYSSLISNGNNDIMVRRLMKAYINNLKEKKYNNFRALLAAYWLAIGGDQGLVDQFVKICEEKCRYIKDLQKAIIVTKLELDGENNMTINILMTKCDKYIKEKKGILKCLAIAKYSKHLKSESMLERSANLCEFLVLFGNSFDDAYIKAKYLVENNIGDIKNADFYLSQYKLVRERFKLGYMSAELIGIPLINYDELSDIYTREYIGNIVLGRLNPVEIAEQKLVYYIRSVLKGNLIQIQPIVINNGAIPISNVTVVRTALSNDTSYQMPPVKVSHIDSRIKVFDAPKEPQATTEMQQNTNVATNNYVQPMGLTQAKNNISGINKVEQIVVSPALKIQSNTGTDIKYSAPVRENAQISNQEARYPMPTQVKTSTIEANTELIAAKVQAIASQSVGDNMPIQASSNVFQAKTTASLPAIKKQTPVGINTVVTGEGFVPLVTNQGANFKQTLNQKAVLPIGIPIMNTGISRSYSAAPGVVLYPQAQDSKTNTTNGRKTRKRKNNSTSNATNNSNGTKEVTSTKGKN